MSKEKTPEPFFSVDEMRSWLAEEVGNVLKECDLRVRDATDFATAYIAGKMTAEQAEKRLTRYEERWGGALSGVFASSYRNDEPIIKAIDRADRDIEKARNYTERVSKGARSRRVRE